MSPFPIGGALAGHTPVRRAMVMAAVLFVASLGAAVLGAGTASAVQRESITSVVFNGSASAPSVTVNGANLGTIAKLGRSKHACGSTPTGFDYGKKFLFADTTDGWNAGEGKPTYDCIGVVVQSYSPEKIVFTFGSDYGVYPVGSGVALLNSGDQFTMRIWKASFAGTAGYTTGTAQSFTTTTPANSTLSLGNGDSDSAAVSGNATDGTPTGTVTFYECGSTASAEPCTSKADPVGSPVGVTAGSDDTSSASSMSFTPSSAGYWCFAAYYSGDSNYAASADTTTDECFDVTVLDGVTSIVSDENSFCGVVASGGVDCWGAGSDGQLGNGTFSGGAAGAVEGVGGIGTLTGVTSLVGDGYGSDGDSFCAVVASGGVDCWGAGSYGQLGNGTFSDSASPVAVEAVGGTGTLTGVTSVVGDGYGSDGVSYCAVLASGGVDCWGYGSHGQLGNGTFYTTGGDGSAAPVEVEGVGGTGTLTGVTSVVGDGYGFCGLLGSGGVDCWGYGDNGQLGDGFIYPTGNEGSATPVEVEGVGGTGTLADVASVVSSGISFCALVASGGVDCWGSGADGQLGSDTIPDTASPVAVEGVGGTGTLIGVANIATDEEDTYCVVLTSGGVDCWGTGGYGQLGNGTFSLYAVTPVAVVGVGGAGTLTGVTNVVGADNFDNGDGFCAVLGSGGVDCWGYGYDGELGNGVFYTSNPEYSVTPVTVEAVGGVGTLTGVTSLAGDGEGYCALLASGGVDCWGDGIATPAEVG